MPRMDTNMSTQINTNKERMNTNILHKDLSYAVQGAFYEVFNKYGRGFKESIYQEALTEEFEKRKLPFDREKRITIHSIDSGKLFGVYIPDFVVDDKIVIEIKATDFTIKSNLEQHTSYLKATRYEVGYLVNFGTPRLYVKRTIYTNNHKPWLNIHE